MKTMGKMIRFDRTVTVEGATYKAGAEVDPERIPPSYLACCLRVGHCTEIDIEVVEPKTKSKDSTDVVDPPVGDPVDEAPSEAPAPAAPARKTRKRK